MITAAVIVVGLVALAGLASFWTERLWFRSVGYSGVFSTLVWTRVILFVVFGAVMAIAVALSMYLAYRFRPVFRPASPEQTSLDRYREAVTPIRVWLLIGISLLMGVFAGTSGAGQWRNFLLWRNSESFGQTDPHFGRDLGFYVFELSWLHFLVDFAMAVLVVAVMGAAVVHYLFGGIRLQAARDKISGAAQVQLSVMVGLLVLVKGVDYYLDRFDLLSASGGYIDGMGYTDDNAVLPAKNILIGIAVICAILFFLNVWRRTWMLPTVGLGLLVLSSILLGMLWPTIMERFQVSPTQADKEAPYIERHLAATKAAYGIDDVQTDPFQAETNLTELDPTDRTALAATVANSSGVRLVDPSVIPQAFQQLQQIVGYYTVPEVLDVDTYTLDEVERDVVIGVRELNQAGLPENSQNWANLHTVYTHGYGLIAAYGNQKRADNTTIVPEVPAWAETNLPPTGDLTDLAGDDGYEGRIYFGENSPSYSIVGAASEDSDGVELDLPRGEDGGTTTTYDGADGVEVGGLFNQLLYAVKFGEPNIVLSGRVNENSKILYDREPARRVEKVAPWLTVDGDALPAMVDGRVVWILDGYTTTDQYPLSDRESFEEMTDDSLTDDNPFQTVPTDEINYMRNAVKATVDAYDGTVTLYAWDEEDPMLKAWMGAFPGTVEDRSEIPEGILDHMRYPEDLFKVQRYQLGTYHVDNASDFYEGNARWQVPADPNQTDSLQPPYRLSVPSGDSLVPDTFSLTSVYTPANRQNLAAFLQVNGDAGSEDYGEFRVRELTGNQVSGPGQIANQIQSDQGVTDALLPYRQGEVQTIRGNLLTLPVGQSLLYVQPLYSIRTSGDGNYPVLRFVAVSFGDDNVGIGPTLARALADVLGVAEPEEPGDPGSTDPDPDPADPGTPEGTLEQQINALLVQADEQFVEAEALLADGDLGGYQDAVQAGQDLVEQALELATGLPGVAAPDDATDTPTDGTTEVPPAEPTE